MLHSLDAKSPVIFFCVFSKKRLKELKGLFSLEKTRLRREWQQSCKVCKTLERESE